MLGINLQDTLLAGSLLYLFSLDYVTSHYLLRIISKNLSSSKIDVFGPSLVAQ